jgi:hypothetical protein
MSDFLRLLAIALALTVAVEVVIAWLFRLRSKTELSTVTLINVITNPLLNYLILVNGFFHLAPYSVVLILSLELGVVIAEWLLLSWVLRNRAGKMLVLAVAMNVCSFLAGLLILN